MKLKIYAALLWRCGWLIGLLVTLGLAGGFLLSKSTPPAYQTSITFLVNSTSDNPLNTEYFSVDKVDRQVKAYVQQLKSDVLLNRVITNLKLNTDAAGLGKRISANVIRETSFVTLNVEDQQQDQAMLIARELIKEFQGLVLEDQNSRYQAAEQTVQKELDNVQVAINQTQALLDQTQSSKAQLDNQNRLTSLLNQNRETYVAFLKSLQEAQLAGNATPDTLTKLQEQLTKTSAIIDELQNQFNSADKSASEDLVRRRQLESSLSDNRYTQSTLTKRLQDLHLVQAQGSGIKVTTNAEKANTPQIRPKLEFNLIVGAAAGLIASLGLILLFNSFNDSSGAIQEVQQELGAASLVFVEPGRKRFLFQRSRSAEPVLNKAFMLLSFNLLHRAGSPQVVNITSASSAKDSAGVMIELGLALAQVGKKVIIVDGNLRQPALHHFFGLSNTQGITTTLIKPEDEMLDSVMSTAIDNLRLLSGGPVPPNPAKLLSSKQMGSLVEQLKTEADLVLINSAPILEATDYLLLDRMAEFNLLVGRRNDRNLKKAVALFKHSGITLHNLVILEPWVRFESRFNLPTDDSSKSVPKLLAESMDTELAADKGEGEYQERELKS